MTILYINCPSGIAGDMFLTACIDLGVNEKELQKELKKLKIDQFRLKTKTVDKKGIKAKQLQLSIDDHHHERHLSDIYKIIESSNLSKPIKKTAKKIFLTLGKAEAFVHKTTLEEIHFHEVGAMDSIIDIIGAAICLDKLKITEVYCSHLPIPEGTINCDHGKIPNPGPATQRLLKGFKTYPVNITAEIITPTGAAILKTIVKKQESIKEFKILKRGFGAGTMDLKEQPNVLQLLIVK